MASNVNKPPILDGTGQSIKSKLSDILQALQNAAVSLGTAAAKDYTTSVTSGNTDLPTSGAVADAIDNMVEANPSGTATNNLTKLGIDGTNYNVVDNDYQNDEKSFTTNDYSTSTHTFTSSTNITLVTIKGVLSALSVVFNALKTAINDHASVLSNLNLALSGKVTSEQVIFNELSEDGHRFGENRITGTAFTATSDVSNENTNFSTVKTVVNNLADYAEENVEIETLPNTAPYLYRQSPAIGSRVMENALVGCSFGVNQLLQNGNFVDGTGWGSYNCSVTYSNNTANMVSNGSNPYIMRQIQPIIGHIYLAVAQAKQDESGDMLLSTQFCGTSYVRNTINSTGVWSNLYLIGTCKVTTNKNVIFDPHEKSSGNKLYVKNFMCIDLTQMFGIAIADYVYSLEQATAGSGIAWLKSQGFDFSEYIDYNTGTLESVNPSAKKVVGKNLLPMTVDGLKALNTSGTWSGNTYTKNNVTFAVQTDNVGNVIKIETSGTASASIYHFVIGENIVLNGNYKFTSGNTNPWSGYNYLCLAIDSNNTEYIPTSNDGVELPSGTYKVVIGIALTTNVDGKAFYPMIRDAAETDPTFEPYTTETYSISQSPLRGVPTLVNDAIVYDGDVRKSDGSVDVEYAEIEFDGSTDESWGYTNGRFYIQIPIKVYTTSETSKLICTGYVNANSYQSQSDKECASYAGYFYVKDSGCADLAAFKTALASKPIQLVYELATPTTESLPPYTNPQKSFVGGTEEFITDNNIPVGHDSEYKALPAMFEDDYIQTIQEFAEEVPTKIIYQDRAYSYVTIDQRSAAGNYYRFVEEIWKNGYCLIGISLLYWGGAPNMFLPYFQITGVNPEPNAHYYIGFMCGENPISSINAITVRLIWRKAD